MNCLTSLINDQTLAAMVNVQAFIAVLLALLVYRLVAPVIDFLNPFIMLISALYRMKDALAHRVNDSGVTRDPRRSGDDLKAVR